GEGFHDPQDDENAARRGGGRVYSRLDGRSGSQEGGQAPREAFYARVVEHRGICRRESRREGNDEAAGCAPSDSHGQTQAPVEDDHQAGVIRARLPTGATSGLTLSPPARIIGEEKTNRLVRVAAYVYSPSAF